MRTTTELIATPTTGLTAAAPTLRRAPAALALAMLLASLGTSIANVGLPTIAQAFGLTVQTVQWVVLAYLLSVTSLIVSVGRLADRIGRRRLLLGGILLFITASLACGFAPTFIILVCARAAQGLGAAAILALTVALVGETVPQAHFGRAMGLLGTMSAVGTAAGPSLGGVLIATFHWRALFLVLVPLGLAALLLARKFLPEDRPSRTSAARFDWPGTLLLALALAAYALAMTIGRGAFGRVNLVLLTAALVSAVCFVFVERRGAAPLFRFALFRDPRLSAGLLTSALVSTVMMTTLIVGPFYLQSALGLKASAIGIALSIGPLVAALLGVPAGKLADRLGADRVTIVGLVGIATGAVLLALIPATFGIAGYLAPIVLVTSGYALFQTANNTAVMRDVSADQRGVVSALLNLSRNLGLITGASMMGAVFALVSQSTGLIQAAPDAIAAGMRATFGVAAILILIALGIAVSGTTKRARIGRNG